MAHGYRAAWKSNQKKELGGKRIGMRWWWCRGKVTKQITKAIERMFEKRLLRKELDDL